MRAPAAPSRSVTDVLADIFGNVQDILRSEIRFARYQVREELARFRPAAALVLLGVAAALGSGLFALLGLMYALRWLMPPWAAALCVAVFMALVAAITLSIGWRRLKLAAAARAARQGLKENGAWLDPQTR